MADGRGRAEVGRESRREDEHVAVVSEFGRKAPRHEAGPGEFGAKRRERGGLLARVGHGEKRPFAREMARGGAEPEQALRAFRKFAGGDIIVGYNVNFDVNFLYDALYSRLGEIFDNDFVDVLRFARRLLPALSNHRQTTVAGFFGIDVAGAHRAEKDCLICAACLERLRAMADEKKIQF